MRRTLLVGGLGWPYDALLAAAFTGNGLDAVPLGALDGDALERGRASLPRGQCAPALYTTGALLAAADSARSRDTEIAFLGLRSCGPCRFSLFEPAWASALAGAGHAGAEVVGMPQSLPGLLSLGVPPEVVLEAIVAGDALAESLRRLRPYVADPEGLERAAEGAASAISRRVASGEAPLSALRAERAWHRPFPPARQGAPLARAVLIGDPWSLHTAGDPQLNLPRVLAAAGLETEAPPLASWLEYLLWQARAAPWGATPEPSASTRDLCAATEEVLRAKLDEAAAAAGLGGLAVPSMDLLAELSAPYLPASLRGGYGHVEVGLAVRARVERRAHVVVSVKSFGCIPSGGVSDAIVPTALGGAIPFLSAEVSGDGDAARESRLMLRAAAALDAAREELGRSAGDAGLSASEALALTRVDPLAGRWELGPRPFACTVACEVGRGGSS